MTSPQSGAEQRTPPAGRVPSLFVAHGSPLTLADKDYAGAMRAFALRQEDLRAIIVVSAHWQTTGAIHVSSNAAPKLIYDFVGFPGWLYNVSYPVRGERALAENVVSRLQREHVDARLDSERGLDHGVWVPLSVAFPDAALPVVQISLPTQARPEMLLAMGRALAPLRNEHVLLVGSGGLVHNLSRLHNDTPDNVADRWAGEFDAWVREQMGRMDTAALVDYQRLAPHAAAAVPTTEHYDPLLFVMGTALPGDAVQDVYEGFRYGSLSLRSFALAAR